MIYRLFRIQIQHTNHRVSHPRSDKNTKGGYCVRLCIVVVSLIDYFHIKRRWMDHCWYSYNVAAEYIFDFIHSLLIRARNSYALLHVYTNRTQSIHVWVIYFSIIMLNSNNNNNKSEKKKSRLFIFDSDYCLLFHIIILYVRVDPYE